MLKVSISLGVPEQQALDAVLASVPYANPHALARIAVSIGLDVLRADPERIPGLLAGRRVRFTPVAEPEPAEDERWQPVGSLIGVEEIAEEVSEESCPPVHGGAK
jgi:hypothetical protein